MLNIKSLLIISSLLIMFFNFINLNNTNVEAEPTMEIYYVAPGDTLWDIAAKRIDHNTDIRDKIDEIIHDNKINAQITVGQKIKLRKTE